MTGEVSLPRVLFLNHTAMIGGAELVLLDVAARLRHASEVVLLSDGLFADRLRAAGVRVEVAPAGPALLDIRREARWLSGAVFREVARIAWQLRSRARAHDLIYANSQKALIVGAVVSALAGRPLLWHLHDILSAEHFSELNIRGAVALARLRRAHVIANSRATAETFIARSGSPERVRIVYNGIDPSPFRAAGEADPVALRRELGLEGKPVVGLFSRLSPWKGQDVLLRALARLPEVHGLFVGDAMFGETAHRDRLHALAAELGLAGRAHFIGFRTDIPRLLRAVDVVVHASTSPEPFGRVIVEGMLSERPVIATRAGGATELVEDGASGLLVAPGDDRALAAAIRDLLEEPERARRLALAGAARAVERFSLTAMLEGITDEIAAATRSTSRHPAAA